MLHNWYTYPNQWSALDQLVPRGMYTFMRVTTETTSSSDPVKKLPLAKSGCIYEEEEKTSSGHSDDSSAPVSKYSRDNCIVNCRRENMIFLCNCQPYYYPTTDDVRFCDLSDLPCIFKYKAHLSRVRPLKRELQEDGEQVWNGQEGMDCDCFPQCNEVNYRVESTAGNLKLSYFNKYEPENYSVFYVFYGKMTGTRYKRDLLLSADTMLSNAGGLFGLFMGFSLLSVVEFVYFFTVRLYFESRDKRKRKESLKRWSAKVGPKSWKINRRARLPFRDDFGRLHKHRERRTHFVY
ncbi:sodium channel protein Nach-like isoform X1 [Cloeon dipterum]|uniref:sodium channel protein Nach-like isoform X1 n=1 Tax=Cloeon dipterum TaxID=197152 RepID=UPI00321F7057